MTIKCCIAGSRTFDDYELLVEYCDRLLAPYLPDVILVEGEAPGADRMGKDYGKGRGLEVIERPAEWQRYGKAAGSIRNRQMAKEVQIAIIFWDDKSTGTEDMIKQCDRLGVTRWIIHYADTPIRVEASVQQLSLPLLE